MFNSLSNKQILEELNKKVYGHINAKKILINLVNSSKIRYYQIHGLAVKESEKIISPRSCLLIGKSGTGKTYLIEALQSVCDFPIYKLDATQLTQTSAAEGIKVSDLLLKMRKWAQDIVETNPKGYYFSAQGVLDQTIVFVDEIDKLGNNGSEGWNQRVQAAWLKFFENKFDGFKHLSFIFAGAFMDLHSKSTSSIGFFHPKQFSPIENLDDEIINLGMLPELVGRIKYIVKLDNLTKKDYKKIFVDLILPQKNKELLFMTGKDIKLSSRQIHSLVDRAFLSQQGVRFLSKQVEQYAIDIEFRSDKHDKLY